MKTKTPKNAEAVAAEAVETPTVATTEVVETETAEAPVAKVKGAKKEKVVAEKKEKVNPVQRTVKVTTTSHLQVFSKKTLDETTASKMRPGAELILEFLEATAQTGEHLVRVRKDGSTRTFYTSDTLAQEVIA